MKSKFDIFISYRREGGLELADSIYQRLINAGYSAFLDLEQLNSGKFNTKLIEVIEQCQEKMRESPKTTKSVPRRNILPTPGGLTLEKATE